MFSVVTRRIALALALISAIVLVGISVVVLNNESANRTNTAPQVVVTSATTQALSWQVEEDKQRFAQLMAEQRSNYDCSANDAVIQAGYPVKALVPCPDYTARITFTSDDPANPPKVDYISSDPDTQVRPITVTVVPVHSCGNDGVAGVPITCSDYWRILWTVSPDAAFVSLGENVQSTMSYDGSGGLWWTGVMAMGSKQGNTANSAINVRTMEVYAGNAAKQISGTPLTVDRLGSRS